MPDPITLSNAEIDQYSITYHVQSGLSTLGWTTVTVDQVRDGWPVYEQIAVPGVYVLMDTSTPSDMELGSHAKRRRVYLHIFGDNDAQRTRLAETIEDMIRDIIPVYNYVTGNETAPEILDYFMTDDVAWEKIPSVTSTPKKEKYRSLVTASLRRVVEQ